MHEEKQDSKTVTHVSTTEARGGSRTKVTRNILAISLGLVGIGFAAALVFGYIQTAESGGDDISADNTVRNEIP